MQSMRRGMFCLAGAVIWMGLLARPARTENARAEAELVYRVQQVLQRHCLRCHGEAAKGGIRLLDRDLLVKQRQVVRPGAADASELLDLVEGGSMPPGNIPKVPREEQTLLRQWIESGAPAFPDYRDEFYVLQSIVRDRARLGDKWKPSYRYVSLNHLFADGTSRDLARARETLERVLRYLRDKDTPEPVLEGIEPAGVVLRIDLQRLGWDRRPYKDPSKLNLYDLALLEYPDGRLPTDSPLSADVVRLLKDAAQVRPIPYVRADWLARAVTKAPLHADFLAALGKPPDSKPPEGIEPRLAPTDATALALVRNTDGASKTVLRGASSIPSRPPHRESKEGTRRTFQDHLAEAMAPNRRGGVPIVPLDGLTYPHHHADPLLAVTFKAIDFAQRMRDDPPAKDTFVVGDRMALWIMTNEKSFVELVQTDNKGVKTIKFSQAVSAGHVTLLPPQGAAMKLEDNEEQDIEEYTLYAYRDAALQAVKAPFPAGKVLHTDKIHDRILHPLYQLRPDGRLQAPDANKLVKMTVRITTVRSGPKKN